MLRKYYYSDPHFGHKNIIKYAQRPFVNVEEMSERIILGIDSVFAEVEDPENNALYCLGDFCWNSDAVLKDDLVLEVLEDHASEHFLLMGNHDRTAEETSTIRKLFKRIIGTTKNWRENRIPVNDVDIDGKQVTLMLSHEPQRDLLGCDYNLYGHHHNNIVRNSKQRPDGTWEYLDPNGYFASYYPWLLNDERYINVGVELIGYQPRTFAELQEMRNAGIRLV